jgi:hypothetical protein
VEPSAPTLRTAHIRANLAIIALLVLAGAAPAAQGPMAPVPFGPGERMCYQVKVSLLGGAGHGSMEVVDTQSVRNFTTYRLRFAIKGGMRFARVDTKLQSWLDVSTLIARRFEQDQKEVRYKRHRIIDFLPEEGRWERIDGGGGGILATKEPLDEVSFLYFVRTIPLEVGRTYTFNRYYKAEGNPVVLKVLRRERVKVPLGKFDTIVVQPIIQTSGLFGEGGQAELYFTDDARRLLVQMRSKMPVLGRLSLVLESYEPGQPLIKAD